MGGGGGSKTQREKSEKNKREDTSWSHIVVPMSLQLCSHASGQKMPGVGAVLKYYSSLSFGMEAKGVTQEGVRGRNTRKKRLWRRRTKGFFSDVCL